jgi:NTE family protein
MRRLHGRPEGAPARITFVLGGGGGPGLAYLCGALRALEETAGLRVADSDLAIGTSSGAIVAARLRVGHRLEDIMAPTRASPSYIANTVLVPRWQSAAGLARCFLGASWAFYRTSMRLPVPAPPRLAQRLFPPALFCYPDWSSVCLPEAWPAGEIWVVTCDFSSHQRVVLHRPERPDQRASLRQAVKASCASLSTAGCIL